MRRVRRKDLRRNKREERGGEEGGRNGITKETEGEKIFSPSRAHACASEET